MPDYRLSKFRGKFAVEYYENGQRRRITLATDSRAVADQRFTAFVANRQAQKGAVAVREAWEGYRKTLGDRPAAKTMGFLWRALEPHFGDRNAETLSEEDCRAYIAARRKAKKSDGTIWTELSRLRSALKWAAKKRMIDKAPALYVPAPAPPREKRMTRAEVTKFLDACEYPHVKLFALLAISTGARMSAILELTWDRVDFGTGMIDFRDPGKAETNKRRAQTPMTDKMRETLREAQKAAVTGYVIEWGGQRVLNVKKGLSAAAKRAGIPWVTAHVFRHSAACLMAEAGVPMSEIAQMLGHKNSKTTEAVYARFSPNYLRKAASVLDF